MDKDKNVEVAELDGLAPIGDEDLLAFVGAATTNENCGFEPKAPEPSDCPWYAFWYTK